MHGTSATNATSRHGRTARFLPTRAAADGCDAGRRSVLWLGGWMLLALPALLTSWGCGPSESGDGAETSGPQPGSGAPPGTQPGTQPGTTAEPRAPSGAASAGSGTEERLVTEIPSLSNRVESLQYTHQTPKPEQRCDNCQFYQADRGGEGVGGCQLFQQGLVKAGGWCASYVKRQA